jgi:hypothetical protein
MKLKAVSIVYIYLVFPSDYVLTDVEKTILEPEVIKPTSKESLLHLTDDKTKIKYMNLLKIFKLPLSFTGSIQFLLELKLLNNNISDQIVLDDDNIKYRIFVNTINSKEMEVNLVLQEDPSIILYKVTDNLFDFPKLDIGDTLIERKLSTHRNTTYLINSLTHKILILNKKKSFR